MLHNLSSCQFTPQRPITAIIRKQEKDLLDRRVEKWSCFQNKTPPHTEGTVHDSKRQYLLHYKFIQHNSLFTLYKNSQPCFESRRKSAASATCWNLHEDEDEDKMTQCTTKSHNSKLYNFLNRRGKPVSMLTVNMFRLTDTWTGRNQNKNMPLLHSKAILWSFSRVWDSCVNVLVLMFTFKYSSLLFKDLWRCWSLSVQMCFNLKRGSVTVRYKPQGLTGGWHHLSLCFNGFNCPIRA